MRDYSNSPDVGAYVGRCNKLQTGCRDLQSDMLRELEVVDVLMIKPASEAKEEIKSLRKTIKKRNDIKVSQVRHN